MRSKKCKNRPAKVSRPRARRACKNFFSSVLPQALPNLVSQTLYMLDVNLRSSTVLGIVGGGGIGFLLLGSIRVLDEATVGAIIITIFVLVYAIELLGSFVRWLVE